MRNNCIFCDIKQKGIIKEEQILEEGGAFSILLSLHPATRGHSLIIPKEHYSSLAEIPEDLQGLLFSAAIRQGEKLKDRLGAKAYIVRANDELYKLETSKGHIGHIHIHVIPRYSAGDNIIDVPEIAELNKLKKAREEILGKYHG